MIIFFLIGILLSITIILLLIKTLFQSSTEIQLDDDHTLLYKKRKNELDIELNRKTITLEQYQELLDSYQKQLYIDLKSNKGDIKNIRFLNNKILNFSVAISAPVIAGVLYMLIGGGSSAMQSQIPTIEDLQKDPEKLLNAFEEKLHNEGGSAEEWQLLAQSYRDRKEYTLSKNSFLKAMEQAPNDPLIQADYIELLMLMNDSKPSEESSALLQQAIVNNPLNPKLLWLAALDASYKNNTRLQIDYLTKLSNLMPEDSAERKTIEKIIAATETAEIIEIKELVVKVSIEDEFKRHLTESSILYVFARASEGPRMPLAVAKLDPNNIPEFIHLNDDMAMAPNMKLSDHNIVNLIALISHSGQAQSSPGDLRGVMNNVSTDNDETIEIVINEIISAE